MEKAQSEAKTLANKVKSRAEGILNDVQSSLAKAKKGELSIPETIQQLRFVHLIVLVFQTFVLYLEDGVFSWALFPLLFLVANLYVVGTRWHSQSDSRHDLKGLTHNTDNPKLASKFAFGLFGGFVLALFVNMISPSGVDTIIGTFFYNLSSYLSVLMGAIIAVFEVYYGAKGAQ